MKTFAKYKTHLAAALIVTAICFTSCEKFLDTDRQGAYTEEDYPYPENSSAYDLHVFGVYNDLRAYSVHTDAFINATSIRSDDADKGSTAEDGGADVIGMDNFPVLTTSGRANALWTGFYGMITKANNAIDEIEKAEPAQPNEHLKQQALAEVRFLRGYSYFMLVRLFGNIPLIDRRFDDPAQQSNVKQSSPDAIYSFLEEDLTFAAANLPLSWDPKFVGRATSGAANGILAKVYLTQKKWSAALGAAKLVISSGQYDLSTNYSKIFGEDGENSKESVFEVQATASPSIPQNNGTQYASIQGVRGANDWNLGWGWNVPSDMLEAAYEIGDPRKERTILYASTASDKSYSIHNELMPIYPGGVPNPRYNHKILSNPSLRRSINRGSWWMNIRILRYADVVLMAAEAANELGQTEEARTALNSIRERARREALAGTLPDIASNNQTELRTHIRHERRIELAMEHDRFFDLVRWGIAEKTMHDAGKKNFKAGRDELLPIPQTQIDLSKGVLIQNNNY